MLLILYYIVEANVLNRSGFHVHSGLWTETNQDATESINPDPIIILLILFLKHLK